MSPLRGLVLGLTAISAVWGVLQVPWETAYGHPPGTLAVATALVHPHSPLWAPPAPMSVEELARQMSDSKPPPAVTAVRRIRWDHWLTELLARWVLLGAAVWPFLAVAARFLAASRAAARFSLGLLMTTVLCLLLWVVAGGWGPPLAGPAFAGILLARAAAAPEAGPAWLGMSPGTRPLGVLAVALFGASALSIAALLLSLPLSPALAALFVTLGFTAGLALAPTGGVARAAWHLGATLSAVGLGEFAVGVADRLSEWASLGLVPQRLPGDIAGGLLTLCVLSAMVAAAALLVSAARRLRRSPFPCAS
jgi:hypothetical protein